MPAITVAKFDGPLRMGVGTSTGHVLLYDIRSSKPLLVKDHMNEIPIKSLEFHKTMNYVYSMDATVVKIWDKNTVCLPKLLSKLVAHFILKLINLLNL